MTIDNTGQNVTRGMYDHLMNKCFRADLLSPLTCSESIGLEIDIEYLLISYYGPNGEQNARVMHQ